MSEGEFKKRMVRFRLKYGLDAIIPDFVPNMLDEAAKDLASKAKTTCDISGGVCWDGGTSSDAKKEGRCAKCESLTQWISLDELLKWFGKNE